MKNIQLIGEINLEMLKILTEDIEKVKTKHITINLSSYGGDVYSALAISGFLRKLKKDKIITIIGNGCIMSAAVLVLSYGNKRLLTKESWVMVHEESARFNNSVSYIEVETKHLRNLETQWSILLEETTGTKAAVWEKLHKDTTYLTPEECLKLGLIDGII